MKRIETSAYLQRGFSPLPFNKSLRFGIPEEVLRIARLLADSTPVTAVAARLSCFLRLVFWAVEALDAGVPELIGVTLVGLVSWEEGVAGTALAKWSVRSRAVALPLSCWANGLAVSGVVSLLRAGATTAGVAGCCWLATFVDCCGDMSLLSTSWGAMVFSKRFDIVFVRF